MNPNSFFSSSRFSCAIAAACALALANSQPATAQTVDLTNRAITSGVINGAIYSVDTTQPSGTGIFGRSAGGVFETVQAIGVEEGYNTSGGNVMDTKRTPQWNHDLLFGSLNTVDINGTTYIPFLLDINQSAGKPLLSLDDVKLFTSSTPSITDPTLSSLLADPRLTLRYTLDGTLASPLANDPSSYVLLDYKRSGSGSGAADMGLFIPYAAFAGVQASDYVYLYSRFGGDVAGSKANAGFEEWTAGGGMSVGVVPEPGGILLISIGFASFIMARRRRP